MSTASLEDIASFEFAECDYVDCACDLPHHGDFDIEDVDFAGAQMSSLDFSNLMPSPPPTESSNSLEWACSPEDESFPSDCNLIASPVITFVKTERKERRKAQNREAQRAYRSRKDEQMKALKQELAETTKQLKTVTEAYKSARVENSLLTSAVQELKKNLAESGKRS